MYINKTLFRYYDHVVTVPEQAGELLALTLQVNHNGDSQIGNIFY